MPKLGQDQEMQSFKLGNYGFSATKVDALGATEYTLVTLVVDDSGSVVPFWNDMKKCIQEVIKACQYSPRSDNLMIRLVKFDDILEEVHGYKLLANCNIADYDNVPIRGNQTALFDAADNAINATVAYGKTLTDNDFSVNGIVFVITDGADNKSSLTKNTVKKTLQNVVRSESLESLITVLIGVNVADPQVKQYLDDFHQEVGFTQFIDLGDANSKKLAKLAEFVSKSISAQSQALGTGGPSQSLTI